MTKYIDLKTKNPPCDMEGYLLTDCSNNNMTNKYIDLKTKKQFLLQLSAKNNELLELPLTEYDEEFEEYEEVEDELSIFERELAQIDVII